MDQERVEFIVKMLNEWASIPNNSTLVINDDAKKVLKETVALLEGDPNSRFKFTKSDKAY